MEDEPKKTIKVSKELWRRLTLWKTQLDASSVEEVIERILKITPASELKKRKRK